MTTPETTTAMDRFYELMDFITGGPTSEASLAACDFYAAALARIEAAEARACQRLEDVLFAEQRATDADIRAEETDADASRLRLELAAAKLGISALAARVAELKEEREWRPGYPTEAGDYVVRHADGAINEARYYTDGHHWGPFNADIVRWAYMPQEPTP